MPLPDPPRLSPHDRLPQALRHTPLTFLDTCHPPLSLLSLLPHTRSIPIRIAPTPPDSTPTIAYIARLSLVHSYLLLSSPPNTPPSLAVLSVTSTPKLLSNTIYIHDLLITPPEHILHPLYNALLRISAIPSVPVLRSFSLVKKLGAGPNARVYLVKQQSTGVKLALKVYEKPVTRIREWKGRVMSARACMQRSKGHPFIVDLRYAVATPQEAMIFMEYCPGGDLFNYVRSTMEPLSELEAKYVVAQLVLAVEWMHRKGGCCDNLHPENVLIDSAGWVRLASFGTAMRTEGFMRDAAEFKKRRGKSGEEYEEVEVQEVDEERKREDLWRLGMLTCFLLTAQFPMKEEVDGESDVVRDFVRVLWRGGEWKEIRGHAWMKEVNWEVLKRRVGRGRLAKRKTKGCADVLQLRGGDWQDTFSVPQWPRGVKRRGENCVKEVECEDRFMGLGFAFSSERGWSVRKGGESRVDAGMERDIERDIGRERERVHWKMGSGRMSGVRLSGARMSDGRASGGQMSWQRSSLGRRSSVTTSAVSGM